MNNLLLLPLAIVQSLLLVAGQVLLKFALARMLPFAWSAAFWKSVFVNWQFAACGICYGAGSLLWFYIIKHFPFSMAYPMVSLSYVFGMIAAILFFHEPVGAAKWLGVLLIMAGCFFIAK
ncbi:MAG: EamA family transporter [Bacteroidales bacterium]|nr:EamA family transporter [Bacteroidales bacterium]